MNCSICFALASKGHKEHRYILISPLSLMSSKHWSHNCTMTYHSHSLRKRLLWAAFTLVFYGFLRASEFATAVLTWQHIHLESDRYTVFVEQSKTDPFAVAIPLPPMRLVHLLTLSELSDFMLRQAYHLKPIHQYSRVADFSSGQATTNNYYPPLIAEYTQQPSTLR